MRPRRRAERSPTVAKRASVRKTQAQAPVAARLRACGQAKQPLLRPLQLAHVHAGSGKNLHQLFVGQL